MCCSVEDGFLAYTVVQTFPIRAEVDAQRSFQAPRESHC